MCPAPPSDAAQAQRLSTGIRHTCAAVGATMPRNRWIDHCTWLCSLKVVVFVAGRVCSSGAYLCGSLPWCRDALSAVAVRPCRRCRWLIGSGSAGAPAAKAQEQPGAVDDEAEERNGGSGSRHAAMARSVPLPVATIASGPYFEVPPRRFSLFSHRARSSDPMRGDRMRLCLRAVKWPHWSIAKCRF